MRRTRRLSLKEIAMRRADRARDADLLQSGWQPDARTLDAAPTIDVWIESVYPGTSLPCLVGHVMGHPVVPDGPATTSPIIARGANWIRTEGRFYRTLEPLRIPASPQPAEPSAKTVSEHSSANPDEQNVTGFVGF
ncbi:hypothetical protein SAMN05216360_102356 [Methylobacterium phyllostachyos]|uniref:Uncharacterized protein n=1 Tax=Methylobacterium phyllostachyos TaxID=582672 RepID=A0A1G9TZL1_9HYPH|nr:hypothetical protein [Methylobacterium phyllostachyos]SDM53096.1 hypothetical protein SAMN05216360_102356 [Methylobacterium phyllostachyos]